MRAHAYIRGSPPRKSGIPPLLLSSYAPQHKHWQKVRTSFRHSDSEIMNVIRYKHSSLSLFFFFYLSLLSTCIFLVYGFHRMITRAPLSFSLSR